MVENGGVKRGGEGKKEAASRSEDCLSLGVVIAYIVMILFQKPDDSVGLNFFHSGRPI